MRPTDRRYHRPVFPGWGRPPITSSFRIATGGTGDLTYALDLTTTLWPEGTRHWGLAFDPVTRTFSGTPEFAGAGSLQRGDPGPGEGFEFTYMATRHGR